MIQQIIRCDGCETVGKVVGECFELMRAQDARQELKRQGWKTGKGGTDWCPKCEPARRRWCGSIMPKIGRR